MGASSNSQDPDLHFLYFMLCWVINVLILIKLFVSILGDCFDQFKARNLEMRNKEKALIALEIENLMVWRRKQSYRMYIQVCSELIREGMTAKWEGVIEATCKLLNKRSQYANENFASIRKRIEAIESSLSNKS